MHYVQNYLNRTFSFLDRDVLKLDWSFYLSSKICPVFNICQFINWSKICQLYFLV